MSDVVVIVGIPSEPPLAEVLDALHDRHADVVVVNQRRFAELDLAWAVDEGGQVDGLLRVGPRHLALRDVSGIYARPMGHRQLPEFRVLPEGGAEQARCSALHDELMQWVDLSPARVVNRTAAMASNGSKPYQAQLIARHGLLSPETIVTNDPDVARSFYASNDRVVYKSTSGQRSIVQTMVQEDLARLPLVRACPVQFQAWVPGIDVRVHVVGRQVFATRVDSEATDYRYAVAQVEQPARLSAYELDGEIADRCVSLTFDLGLEFAGIDLKITPDDDVYCFEANPSPAYTYFEGQTGQPIAAAVAELLIG